MSYKHYWSMPEGEDAQDRVSKAWAECMKILDKTERAYRVDVLGGVKYTVVCNDEPDDAGFHIPKKFTPGGAYFVWQTTQPHAQYDDVVVMCLCVMAENGYHVTSDGTRSDWEAGRSLAETILKRPVSIPSTIDAEEE